MKKYNTGNIDSYISTECMAELSGDHKDGHSAAYGINDEEMLEILVEHNNDHANDTFFRENPDYKRVVDLYSKIIGNDKIVCLSAHGGDNEFGEWVFEQEGEEYSVQDWINEQDGKYAAILLNVCNESAKTITSKESIVLAPNYIWGDCVKLREGGKLLDLYLPKVGYIDSYVIDYEIGELEKKLRK
jgi:hypothetical protein